MEYNILRGWIWDLWNPIFPTLSRFLISTYQFIDSWLFLIVLVWSSMTIVKMAMKYLMPLIRRSRFKYNFTTLRFNQDNFVCEQQDVKENDRRETLELFSGSNAEIREITQTFNEDLRDSGLQFRKMLVIRTNHQDHVMWGSAAWSKPERDWVMRTINRWLQQSQDKNHHKD